MLCLIPYPRIDPVLVRLGPLEVHWYGIAYLLAFVIGYVCLRRMSDRGTLRLSRGGVSDLISWIVVGVLLGGRLGWWLFYSTHPFAISRWENWYEPIAIWHGGMSFHGGLIGVALAVVIWTRATRAPFWNIVDALALVVPIGLFFGRIANFINGELYGRPTTAPFAMIFPTDPQSLPRHPSQLYEAFLEGPLLLACLWIIRRLTRREGVVAGSFLILYGVFRFGVEFAREPDPQLGYIAFGWLTMGQLLSLLLALAGIILVAARRRDTAASAHRLTQDEQVVR